MLYFLTAALLPALLLHASASTQEPLVYGSTVSASHSLAFQRVITDEFSAFVRDVLSETNVRGLSLGIIKPGGSLEFDAWGNRTEDGDPVDSETLFHIGSCTKAFLSASLGILMDDFNNGRNSTSLPQPLSTFNWETKVKDLLPSEWMLRDQFQHEKTNLRDILSHVSGQIGHDLSYRSGDTMEDIVRRQQFHVTPFELRQLHAYNNEMYIIATYILQKYSSISFADFWKKRIFEPLGMNSTVTSPSAAKKLSQTWAKTGRRIPFWIPDKDASLISGAGSIISSTKDMTKWLAMMLNEGVDPMTNATIIPKTVIQEITTASVILSGVGPNENTSITGYGMGWGRFSYKGYDLVTHSGGLPGFLSRVQFFPRNGVAMVSLTNADGGDVANSIVINRATDAIFNLESGKGLNPPAKGRSKQHLELKEKSNLSLALNEYAGTYSALDYGNITFCPLTSGDNLHTKPGAKGDYCRSLRHDFTVIDDAEGRNNSGSVQLIASMPRIWSKQLRLTHLTQDAFSIAGVTLFPEGFGNNATPFAYVHEESEGAAARFIIGSTGEGKNSSRVVGFFACGILRDGEGAQGDCITGEGAKPGSLVWFAKV